MTNCQINIIANLVNCVKSFYFLKKSFQKFTLNGQFYKDHAFALDSKDIFSKWFVGFLYRFVIF